MQELNTSNLLVNINGMVCALGSRTFFLSEQQA